MKPADANPAQVYVQSLNIIGSSFRYFKSTIVFNNYSATVFVLQCCMFKFRR